MTEIVEDGKQGSGYTIKRHIDLRAAQYLNNDPANSA